MDALGIFDRRCDIEALPTFAISAEDVSTQATLRPLVKSALRFAVRANVPHDRAKELSPFRLRDRNAARHLDQRRSLEYSPEKAEHHAFSSAKPATSLSRPTARSNNLGLSLSASNILTIRTPRLLDMKSLTASVSWLLVREFALKTPFLIFLHLLKCEAERIA
jgi:hypothetical protein